MASSLDDVAASPGGESVVSSKRGASPDDGPGSGTGADGESGAAAAGSARKKKKLGASSRGVAHLTPEQLEKKRANDRIAQRAIRERTKNQIDTLERRIEELTSQQPYQELQAVIKAKEAVERENVEIKRKLAALIGELQPLIGSGSSSSEAERAYASPTRTYTPMAPNSAPPPAPLSINNASTPGSATSPGSLDAPSTQSWQGGGGSTGGSSGGNTNHANPTAEYALLQLNQQRQDLRHSLDMGPERLGLDFLLDPNHRIARIQNGVNGAQDTPQYQHVPIKHDWTAVRHGQALRIQPTTSSTRGAGNQSGSADASWDKPPGTAPTSSPQSHTSETPKYALPIINCESTCPLDSLLLDFLIERRQRAAEGLSAQELIGPRYPSVSSLLNPSHSVYSHPLSKVFTDILGTFPDLSTLPERVAVLYIMFLIMRWQISPSQESYDRLPEWVRPLPCQVTIPHPAWCDHIPFPRMRDKIIRDGSAPDFVFDNFFIPFTSTLSLNWPYEGTDTLLRSPDSEELLINPVFERHLRNPDNWTLGEAFARTFPSLDDTYNYKPRGRGYTKR